MGSDTVLAIDWWAQLGLVDEASLLHDQQAGGKIAAAAGFLPLLVLGMTVATRRSRSGVLADTVKHP
jgi:cytochrome c oxidase assembly factor CtaG